MSTSSSEDGFWPFSNSKEDPWVGSIWRKIRASQSNLPDSLRTGLFTPSRSPTLTGKQSVDPKFWPEVITFPAEMEIKSLWRGKSRTVVKMTSQILRNNLPLFIIHLTFVRWTTKSPVTVKIKYSCRTVASVRDLPPQVELTLRLNYFLNNFSKI